MDAVGAVEEGGVAGRAALLAAPTTHRALAILELKSGRLWMLARTSRDNHHECFSEDGGESWSAWQPSRFYGTLTMPTLFRLGDGRILLFWCNTTPLPEADRTKEPDR